MLVIIFQINLIVLKVNGIECFSSTFFSNSGVGRTSFCTIFGAKICRFRPISRVSSKYTDMYNQKKKILKHIEELI